MRPPRRLARPGFTLAELLLAVMLFTIVLALVVPYFRATGNSLVRQAGRFDAQQNAVHGVRAIDRDLRVAGGNVVDRQPPLVRVARDAITFNTDLVSVLANDFGAVYYDPDADPDGTGVLPREQRMQLPNSTTMYPDSTYMRSAGARSDAETISYWVSRDSTSPRTDEYILFRRVNVLPAQAVARGIVVTAGNPIFRFYKDSAGRLIEIPQAQLPLFHSVPLHRSPADTGVVSRIDSVRLVKVKLRVRYRDSRDEDTYRTAVSTVRIENWGITKRPSCGTPPVLTGTVTATSSAVGDPPSVTLGWPASTDEATGERDVESYALYKRLASDTAFTEPFASIGASLRTTYDFVDTDVQTGDQWLYGVTAQDCGLRSSDMINTATAVTVN
jgi:prepilin-type N-terminal cleavage/methylation domain-containing protein